MANWWSTKNLNVLQGEPVTHPSTCRPYGLNIEPLSPPNADLEAKFIEEYKKMNDLELLLNSQKLQLSNKQ
jgi:hypothetical protein